MNSVRLALKSQELERRSKLEDTVRKHRRIDGQVENAHKQLEEKVNIKKEMYFLKQNQFQQAQKRIQRREYGDKLKVM